MWCSESAWHGYQWFVRNIFCNIKIVNFEVAYDLSEPAAWIALIRKCNALVWSRAGLSMFGRTDTLHGDRSGQPILANGKQPK